MSDEPRIVTETRGPIFLIGLNRPAKMNAFDRRMLRELSAAFAAYEQDEGLRCAVVFAHGEHFTAGLDLMDVAPQIGKGKFSLGEGAIDPWGVHGPRRSKPSVIAVHGRCLTLGIELILAQDVAVAADDTRFAQIEIKRGIFPFGGATYRLPLAVGWGNAMRWLLTGDELGAAEAHRIGLVQEVVPRGQQLERALAIAETIAAQAPLGVRATLESARHLVDETAAAAALLPRLLEILESDDAREGLMSFVERRTARFTGK